MRNGSARTLTSIDLFAGCGGLTRGLEWAGFETIAFNELNRDAADSFAANFPGAMRLDGDIRNALTEDVITEKLAPLISSKGGLDLLCGGPPCQGYSGIGHRRTHPMSKRDLPTNHLYHEMVRAIERLQPKSFLFENVEGILTSAWYDFAAEKSLVKSWNRGLAFTVKDLKTLAKSLDIRIRSNKKHLMLDELSHALNQVAQEHREVHKGEIFRDVLQSFESISGYTCQPTLIHAYGFGVPQNRPRVMIMGVQSDFVQQCKTKPSLFNPSLRGMSYAAQLRNNGGLFPSWDEHNITAPDLIDVLSDLDFDGWTQEQPHYRKKPKSDFQKFMRAQLPKDERGRQILTEHEFSRHKPHVVERFQYMLDNNVSKKEDLPPHMRTRKFNQHPLPARWKTKPSITVTSLPDDYVHYRRPRTFSVREWARLQTFPDHHIFCGKRTTGGPRRAGSPGNWDREVPKYTQIGNAVPPLLAKAIGQQIRFILGA